MSAANSLNVSVDAVVLLSISRRRIYIYLKLNAHIYEYTCKWLLDILVERERERVVKSMTICRDMLSNKNETKIFERKSHIYIYRLYMATVVGCLCCCCCLSEMTELHERRANDVQQKRSVREMRILKHCQRICIFDNRRTSIIYIVRNVRVRVFDCLWHRVSVCLCRYKISRRSLLQWIQRNETKRNETNNEYNNNKHLAGRWWKTHFNLPICIICTNILSKYVYI